ncbi:precorrin-6A synthase (deacetylating) [Micromonospora peucetia]|uniref:Precorrin-6A synthase (Deacetylating) n=1 Tax=Micromonospora peucetia TaxID=47871 RepID=A0A1C6VUR6_9ACTN|nr:precorrin-6A synthase (deacetylating) [Micromonospora peucetia]MCX4388105.1 precorrin-6A synthase (deacetylating) [Micromonospora peucetia]SCL70045.1 precorrin-6A synthase (deacetylating) [Micromonospora peucetia]
MRTILIIGIGAGDPGQLTLAAADALRQADVFFLLDKGAEKHDLIALRQDLLARFARADHRLVEVRDPERDRTADGYVTAVDDWRRERADLLESAIAEQLADGGCGAFLVWGDPALYDSTIAVVEEIRSRGTVAVEHRVIPGVSSIATLAARHRIGLNRVGRPFLVTTGRRIATGLPHDVDDIVVMLDAHCAFTRYTDQELDIFWGAYLGTPDEILVSGPLAEVAPRIVHERQAARERKGWIMDTYLLRRRAG